MADDNSGYTKGKGVPSISASALSVENVPRTMASVSRTQSQSLSSTAEALLRAPPVQTTFHTPKSLDNNKSPFVPSPTSLVSSRPPSYRTILQVPQARPPVVGSAPIALPMRSQQLKDAVESPPAPLTMAESKQRLRQMQLAVEKANLKAPQRETKGLFRVICSTDVLFLLDTTSSMRKYIDAAKDQIRSIIQEFQEAFLGETTLRVAIVGYKDHCVDPNVQFLDFTTSMDEARAFLASFELKRAEGYTADALGGLGQAVQASWMYPSRTIIHIADAPGHSRALHDMSKSYDPKYFEPGSEPHGLKFQSVMQQLVDLSINFTFLRIKQSTDRMVKSFSNIYELAGADVQLLESNRFFKSHGSTPRVCSDLTGPSHRLRYMELNLGIDPSILKFLVLKSITDSVTRMANRHSLILSNRISSTGHKSIRNTFVASNMLSILREHEPAAVEICLEKEPAQWELPGWLDKTWQLEGCCPDVIVYSESTLADMMDSNDSIKLSYAQVTIHARSKPFGKGAQRLASYARMAGSASPFVVKSHTEGGKSMEYLIEDMRVQALCKAFALEFNGLVKPEQSIDFLVTACLQDRMEIVAAGEEKHLSLEPYLPGDYVKYNNNGLFVREDTPNDKFNRVAQAFSHFTFERSWGHFMVVDLQGVGNLLTDPAVHTKDTQRLKLSELNLHSDGFKCFFVNHHCNEVCQQLGLVSNRKMAIDEVYTFRREWPALEPTICCSNKFCQRIVRLAESKTSRDYPDHRWCGDCWPQLETSVAQWTCTTRGDQHEFDVCRFFYTSQGTLPPKKCPDHLERDLTLGSTASVGGGLWSRRKAESRRSIVLGNEY